VGDFSRKVDKWVSKAEKRIRAVARTAVQDVVNDANTPRPAGRMRVDTGFLRASIAAALGRMPSGERQNPGDTAVPYNEGAVSAVLLRWQPGKDDLYVGWTANYARPREYRDGFLRGATEKWDEYVDSAAKRARRAGL
jgi:hypothetical protein